MELHYYILKKNMFNKHQLSREKAMDSSKSILHTLSSVTVLIVFGKLLGFAKQMVVASKFGTTIETDIFTLAQSFIENTQYMLAQALLTSFTAIYIKVKEKNELEAQKFSCDTIKASCIITIFFVAFVFVTSKYISYILAPTYSWELSLRLSNYLRLFAPLLIVYVWTAVFQALLNSNKRFIPGEFISINQSIITIAMVIVGYGLGIKALVISLFAYSVINFAFLGIFSSRYIEYHNGNPFKNQNVTTLIRMAGPLLVGYATLYINQQVDKILASGLDEGTVTAMWYATVLSNLVSVFIATFCSILFTYITSAIAKNEHNKAATISTKTALLLTVFFLPVSILTIIEAEDIVKIVFGRGAFGKKSVIAAASALRGYGFIFVPYIFREVYSRILYGYQDSKSPMISSSISITINIILSIALCPKFGVFGITLASSISMAVCGALNVAAAKKHSKVLNIRVLLKKLPILTLGGFACGFAASFCMKSLSTSGALLRFLLTTLSGILAYAIVVGPVLYRIYVKNKEISDFNIPE